MRESGVSDLQVGRAGGAKALRQQVWGIGGPGTQEGNSDTGGKGTVVDRAGDFKHFSFDSHVANHGRF